MYLVRTRQQRRLTLPQLKNLIFASFVLSLVCLAPAVARADTIVITSGTYEVSQRVLNVGCMSNDVNFTLCVSGESNAPNCLDGCLPGQLMSPSFSSTGFDRASIIYNGVGRGWPDTVVGAVVQFQGPFVPLDVNNLMPQLPFTFTGVAFIPATGERFTLSGSGIVAFEITAGPSGSFTIRRAVYTFRPETTPEPASLLLLGSGGAALALRVRRGRRDGQSSESSD
jgi:hypothetical protein